MSFFKDFKDDLSLAVNELLPGDDLGLDDELEDSSEMMVNTLEGDLDIESELSKLDGLLEHVDAPEEVKHVKIEPEEPVLEALKPEKEPSVLKEKQKEKPTREETVEAMISQFDTVLEKEEDLEKRWSPSAGESAKEAEPALQQTGQQRIQSALQQGRQRAQTGQQRAQSALQQGRQRAQQGRQQTEPVQQQGRQRAQSALQQTAQQRTRPASQQRPQTAQQQTEPEPAVKSVFHNHENRKTNTTIKEELPMNDELTNETTAAMDDELSADALEVTDEVSIITEGTTIKGNLSTTGSFSISGRVEGNVQCNGKLEVTGTIKGNSSSSEVFSDAAKIEGEIMSTGTVKIGLGSVVVGNIAATSAVIAGAVKGDIDVQGPVVVDTSAVIVGNIKSRSVQINNGAVIEGFCSQCYADIDVDSLFGESKKGK